MRTRAPPCSPTEVLLTSSQPMPTPDFVLHPHFGTTPLTFGAGCSGCLIPRHAAFAEEQRSQQKTYQRVIQPVGQRGGVVRPRNWFQVSFC
jgi:hypothetical protein